MKKQILLLAFATLLLSLFTSCGKGGGRVLYERTNDEINSEFGITDVLSVCYTENEIAYIGACDRSPKNTDDWEGILIRVDLSTNDAKVLYREKTEMEYLRSLTAARLENGTDVIFTGYLLFFVNGDQLTDFIDLDEAYTDETTYHFARNRLGFVSYGAKGLYYLDPAKEPEPVLIYQGTDAAIPFHPGLSPGGDRILYQKGAGPDLPFRSMVCYDIENRTELLSLEDIVMKSDYLYYEWIDNDRFVTWQAIEDNESFGGKASTQIVLYNINGDILSDFMVEGYMETALLMSEAEPKLMARITYGFETKELYDMLAVIDLENKTAEMIYDPKCYIFDEDISPDRETIFCVQEDKIVELDRSALSPARLRTVGASTAY